MANLKNIYDINVEIKYVLDKGGRYDVPFPIYRDEIQSGKIAVYDDTSAIGYFEENSKVTHVLFGNFVEKTGLDLEGYGIGEFRWPMKLCYRVFTNILDPNFWYGYDGYSLGGGKEFRISFEQLETSEYLSKEVLGKFKESVEFINDSECASRMRERMSDELIQKKRKRIEKDVDFWNETSTPEIFGVEVNRDYYYGFLE